MQKSTTKINCRWLVSPRYDLFFFIGSCVFTWIFLGIYKVMERSVLPEAQSVLVTYFIFTALFDHPHIFQTFSRTHRDRSEFQNRKWLYTWGVAIFFGLGVLISLLNLNKELIIVCALWGSWHIIRQHVGLIKAYKYLNNDFAKIDNHLDNATFYLGMFACIFYDYAGEQEATKIYGDLHVTFPYIPEFIVPITWYLFVFVLILYICRQIWNMLQGKGINVPKLLLMSSAFFTHYLIFYVALTPFLIAEALETVYHNVQYQGWILYYQKRQFKLNRIVLKWFLAAMGYGILVGVIEVCGLLNKGWSFLFPPFAMLVIFHYYIDGKIWKFRNYPQLKKNLLSPK